MKKVEHSDCLSSPEKGWLALVSWLNVIVRDLQLVSRKAFEEEKERFQTAGDVRGFTEILQCCCSFNHTENTHISAQME